MALNTFSAQALTQLQDKIDVTVYLQPELTSTDIQTVRQQIEKLPVKRVDVVTAAQALDSFRAKHTGNELITESLLELSQNPLGASIVVRALALEDYPQILKELRSSAYTRYIREVRFEDYQQVITKVEKFSSKIHRIAFTVSMMFLLLALLVVFNAMRLNMYTHREEIAIMRLVGASSWFVRGPFLLEGVMYAGLATVLTTIIFFPILGAVQPYLNSLFSGQSFDMLGYFRGTSLQFFGWQFLGVAILNTLASLVAMRRYLKQ